MISIRQQFRNHSVALFSMAIAISALGYNTWRNEKTEEQRNIRHAAFRVLETIGELREVVDERYYYHPFREDMSNESQLRLRGYGRAALTRDLLMLLPPPAPAKGQLLHTAWLEHYNALDDLNPAGKHSQGAIEAEQSIGKALEDARVEVLEVIRQLK